MKMKKSHVRFLAFVMLVILIFLVCWLSNENTKIWGDVMKKSYSDAIVVDFQWFHISLTILTIISTVALSLVLLVEIFNWDDEDDCPLKYFYDDYSYHSNNNSENKVITSQDVTKYLKKIIKWIVIILLIIFCGKFVNNIYKDNKFLYNTSKKYQNAYVQKVQEKQGFYDKLWKTYLQKDKITNVNKETFIQVTKIIMENRQDGKNVTWKWLQENQNIPYGEFTKFYADLSVFITSQREDYFNIEKECQAIANKNNTLLDTFPNNFYNRFLKLEKIKFEYGFLSDSTVNVFRSRRENIKQ